MPNGGGVGFGYSIAGGSDVDDNEYPGSYIVYIGGSSTTVKFTKENALKRYVFIMYFYSSAGSATALFDDIWFEGWVLIGGYGPQNLLLIMGSLSFLL